jgi:RHS repeat-associated protein
VDPAEDAYYTQKELDPDFIAFNSENRRYHFPYRFYKPFQGMFAQIDPMRLKGNADKRPYLYASGNPVFHTDAFGLQDDTGTKAGWCALAFISAFRLCGVVPPTKEGVAVWNACVSQVVTTELAAKEISPWDCVELLGDLVGDIAKALGISEEAARRLLEGSKGLFPKGPKPSHPGAWSLSDPAKYEDGGEDPYRGKKKKGQCCYEFICSIAGQVVEKKTSCDGKDGISKWQPRWFEFHEYECGSSPRFIVKGSTGCTRTGSTSEASCGKLPNSFPGLPAPWKRLS